MIHTIWQTIQRVFKDLFAAGGLLASAIGAVSDLLGKTFILPSWVWWALGVILLVVTASRLQWDLQKEKDKNRKPTPQIPLSPLIRATGSAKDLKEGLLKDALRAYAQRPKGGIDGFISYLADLPDGVSKMTKAQKLAAEMSDQLIAKIAVNPLLNAPGQKLDPAVLFTATNPGQTRISVINFSGLQADANRQDFANQLQMALFTFIRKSPSKTPRLYVLDEAQNFAPSQSSTASKASAKALAAQARKFGLGMIFATQAPRGIDTNIVSNCLTHFYGRMSSPQLIDSTKEMMAARGKAAQDLGALITGTFYYSTEHMSQPAKLKTLLCLTYHPQNPATVEEIVKLARRS